MSREVGDHAGFAHHLLAVSGTASSSLSPTVAVPKSPRSFKKY